MATYLDISLPDIDAFLSPRRFRRNNDLTYRGRPIKEIVYERTLPGKPNHIVRVYSTINRFGQERGRGRKVGKDAIRVQVLYRDDQGEVLLYQTKRVHRVANWKENLQKRFEEILAADIKVVLDKRGQPMTLRTKGAKKFWGSRDYPNYQETRRYESEFKAPRGSRRMVINTKGGKVHSIVKWTYYPDGSKNYEHVPLPKPIRNITDPRQVQKFYTTLGVTSHLYNMDSERFAGESYPTCYLCGLPAQLEVLTAVGMRNFCSNKCRGYYEGVDYGDYDSPKLEHQLTISNYFAGYMPSGYAGQESTLNIECGNCDVTLKEDIPQYTDLLPNKHFIKTYVEEFDDYDEEPCLNHELTITRYLSNTEEWDGIRLGEIAFRCSKCGYRDMIYADIPEGCSNTGRKKPTFSQIMGNTQTDRMRLP